MTYITYIERKIKNFSPQFDFKSLRLLGAGTESVAYLVNEEWVFRFPKKSLAVQSAVEKEIALLATLGGKLPIKTPDFQHVARDANDLVYVGYPLLSGIPLSESIFGMLSVYKQEQVLQELAVFMQALHSFPVKEANDCGVTVELYKGAYHQEQKQFLKKIQHLLSSEEIATLETIIADYEKNKENFTNAGALLHADLKPEHILFDRNSGRIAGVIDWGDVCIGDPDYDFTCLYLHYGQHFITKLLKYFPLKNAELVFAKIQFFITIRWLQDIVLFLQSNDEKFVSFCLTSLRKHLKNSAFD